MRKEKSYLIRHTLFSTVILWALIVIGVLVAAPLTVRLSLFRPDLNAHLVKAAAELLETQSRSPEEVIGSLRGEAMPDRSGDFFVVDEGGNLLAQSYNSHLEQPIDPRALPEEISQVAILNKATPAPGSAAIIRLAKFPHRFLVFRPKPRTSPEEFMLVAILIFVSVLFVTATLSSSFILLRKLRAQAVSASEIMTQIQNGNLNARLQVGREDEFGRMRIQFNRMADEVERLFEKNRLMEKSRIHLLQEIGHDLRTPLYSLSGLLEMIRDDSKKLSDPEKKSLLATGWREVKFTQRLVDDLLFLARVEDPACVANNSLIDLAALIRSEVINKSQISSLKFSLDLPDELLIKGDAQLLTRLIRNALENSISYSNMEVDVRLKKVEDRIEISFDDDGSGFSDEALRSFGQKRPQRMVHEESGGRISLGLGSVIMTAITKLYQGSVTPSNRAGEKSGGRVTLVLRVFVVDQPKAKAS